jgi:hypothetical protein
MSSTLWIDKQPHQSVESLKSAIFNHQYHHTNFSISKSIIFDFSEVQWRKDLFYLSGSNLPAPRLYLVENGFIISRLKMGCEISYQFIGDCSAYRLLEVLLINEK